VPSYRPATAADVALAVRAGELATPGHPHPFADEVELFWEYSDALGPTRRWVVDEIGLLSVNREGEEPHAWVELDLPADAPTGEWAAVYDFAVTQAGELGAAEAVAEVWADQAAAITALEGGGWERRRVDRFWRLELQPARERLRSQLEEALERLQGVGLAVRPASELGGEEVYRALWKIHEITQPDIPRSVAFVPEPFDVWKGWMSAPRVLPERVWVGLTAGERPVGYSYLAFRSNGLVETGYTCLLREARGAGLARAMKLASLSQAAELGVEAAETDNDSENAPIIHLNQSLGYQEIVGRLAFHKPVA